jgi:4-diphosphocytidyl-2-C-methyl-D-erythritol kinase
VIADVLAALGQSNAWLVRMSGSGATCFALYDDKEQMQQAATKIGQNQPNWWLMQGRLR